MMATQWSPIDGCILTILGFLAISILYATWEVHMQDRDKKRGVK